MFKGLTFIFLTPFVFLASFVTMIIGVAVGVGVLFESTKPSPYQQILSQPSQSPYVAASQPTTASAPAKVFHAQVPMVSLSRAQQEELRDAIARVVATAHRASFCGAMGALGFTTADLRQRGIETTEMLDVLHHVTTDRAMRRDAGAIMSVSATLSTTQSPAHVQDTMIRRCTATRATRANRPTVPEPITPQPLSTEQESIAAFIARTRSNMAQQRARMDRAVAQLDDVKAFANVLQSRAKANREWWPRGLQPTASFCSTLASFSAAVVRDRDVGWSLHDSLQTLDLISPANLASVMEAIILDIYSDPHLTPDLAHKVTETLCQQGVSPQY